MQGVIPSLSLSTQVPYMLLYPQQSIPQTCCIGEWIVPFYCIIFQMEEKKKKEAAAVKKDYWLFPGELKLSAVFIRHQS